MLITANSTFTCLSCNWQVCNGNCFAKHHDRYHCHNPACAYHCPQPPYVQPRADLIWPSPNTPAQPKSKSPGQKSAPAKRSSPGKKSVPTNKSASASKSALATKSTPAAAANKPPPPSDGNVIYSETIHREWRAAPANPPKPKKLRFAPNVQISTRPMLSAGALAILDSQTKPKRANKRTIEDAKAETRRGERRVGGHDVEETRRLAERQVELWWRVEEGRDCERGAK